MGDNRTRLVVINRDAEDSRRILEFLDPTRYDVQVFHESKFVVPLVKDLEPQFLLLELDSITGSAANVIGQIRSQNEDTAIIILADPHHSEQIQKLMEIGAEDFISKPFDPGLVEISMHNIMDRRSLREQINRLKSELKRDHAFGMLVGETEPIIALTEFIEQVADTDLNILIRGESGTGKDVTARLIHQFSGRREGPFIKVNCAALPDNLIESELFGYEKGAFTGAIRAKPGRFQLAHGGTIFLDEITEIPFFLQSKLLQVLEHREFMSVGGTKPIHVDCRCVAATNANLTTLLAEQRFREDLFFRLNEFSVFLPPLRDRKEDIPLLVDYFLSLYSERYQRPRKSLPYDILRRMMEYQWPGNVRELESLLKRYIVLDSEDVIYQTIGDKEEPTTPLLVEDPVNALHEEISDNLLDNASSVIYNDEPPTVPASAPEMLSSESPQPRHVEEPSSNNQLSLKEIVDRATAEAEKSAILTVLHNCRWNRRKAATQLGISYSSLLRRIDRYQLNNEV